jgi:hypothetical protein
MELASMSENGSKLDTHRAHEEVEAYFSVPGRGLQPFRTRVLLRDGLDIDSTMAGPAILRDEGSTILVPPDFMGRVDARGNLIVTWGQS